MELNVLTIALAATAFGALAANAQTTVIEERRSPSVTIQTEAPAAATSTTVKERNVLGTESKTTTTTTGSGLTGDCTNKTVHKEGILSGDKTVSKTTCD